MVEKGTPWERPGVGPGRVARRAATTPTSPPRCATIRAPGCAFRPDADSDLARAVGLHARPADRGAARSSALDALRVAPTTVAVRGERGRARRRRPTAAGWLHAGARVRVEVDGRVVHDGPATAVVVANGQFLRGPTSSRGAIPATAGSRSRCTRSRRRSGAGRAAPAARRGCTSRTRDITPDGRPPRRDPRRSRRAARSRSTASRTAGPGDRRRGPGALPARGRDAERRPGRRPKSAERSPSAPGSAPIPSPALAVRRHAGGETVGVYPSEHFTDDEAAVLRPYFTNLDGPVFALVNLPEVVKGALFARYSRTHKSLRRLFLDEFVGDLDLTGDLTVDATRRAAARRGALRPRVPRVRRRLRRAARRRAPRVRAVVEPAHEDPRVGPPDGVPRAVDALHPVRQRASAAATGTTATAGGARVAARRALHRRHGRAVRRPTPRCCRSCSSGRASATRRSRATPTSSTSRRSRRRRATRSAASCPRRRCRTSGSTAPVRRTRRCCCACARTRCPRRAATPAMMLEELRKVIPSFLTRVDREDRGVAWSALPGRDPRRTPASSCDRIFAGERARAASRGHAHRLRPRGRGQAARGRSATRRRTSPKTRSSRKVRTLGDRRARRVARARTSASDATVGTSPGRAFERIDYRFDVARRLRRVPRSATSPHAHDRVAAAVDRVTATRSRRRSRKPGSRDPFDDAMERSAALLRRDGSIRFPEQASYAVSLAYRLRFVDADERARSDARDRAAHRAAGPSRVPAGRARRCTASSPSRPVTARSPRR